MLFVIEMKKSIIDHLRLKATERSDYHKSSILMNSQKIEFIMCLVFCVWYLVKPFARHIKMLYH